MATVILTESAREEFDALPTIIRIRVQAVLIRLADWPDVSGAKPLRGELAGNWRIRTGDYRVVFTVAGDVVTVWKIGHRGGVYD
jgi:mRNA interferase RelE/StbE